MSANALDVSRYNVCLKPVIAPASRIAIVVLLVVIATSALAQRRPQNRGRLGTWYWNSKGVTVRESDEDEGIPLMEKLGDAPTRSSNRFMFAPASFPVFAGPYRSIQVNVDAHGRNIPGDAANEPSLAVDPNNRNRIAVGWRQFDHVDSNFRQAGNALSFDGGSSWLNKTVLTPGVFRSDPVIGVDSAGNFYYNSLQQSFFTDVFLGSARGRMTAPWSMVGPATGGDKQWMTVDTTTSVGRGNLYETWSTAGNNYSGRQFSRSTNGGRTWMDPVNLPGSPVWGTLDVAKNGDLYIGALGNGSFTFLRSSNAKFATQTPTFEMSVPVDLGGAIVFGSALNPAGLMGQCWIVTDKSAGPNTGNIYMLCSVGVDATNPCDVHFSRSTDGGRTWSRWTRINDDAPGQGASHWFGTLAIAPNGRLDACWYDNRANPSIPNSALYFSSSYDGGVTWTSSTLLSPRFNPNIGYPNQSKMGDYLGLVSDNAGAAIAYAATFNGEEDIWFVRVPTRASESVNATQCKAYDGSFVRGNVSDVWSADSKTFDIDSALSAGVGNLASMQADFTVPYWDVNSLGVRVKVKTPVAATGMVWLFNWGTGQYDFQKAFSVGSGSTDATAICAGNVTPYIDRNGNVRAVFRATVPAAQSGSGFRLQVDLMRLLYG